jgi:hypothetical protein
VKLTLKTNIPHKLATKPGPVVTIGNATTKSSSEFATNQEISAMDQSAPDTNAGRMHSG